MKTLIIKTLLICAMLNASAQNARQAASLNDLALPVATKGWIDFRPGNELTPYTLFTENKQLFGLTAQDEMRQYKTQTDEIGFTHIRFQQYYKGLKVEGAEVILHHNGTYLKSMNGKIAEQLNLNVIPTITAELALSNAKTVCKAEKFVWEHADIAAALSKNSNGQKDFSKPVGELVICRADWSRGFEKENMVLAYKYRIITLPMTESNEVYIDAVTGNVIHKNPLAPDCNANTGNTTWYGSRTFNATFYGWPKNLWLLESNCSGEAGIRSRRGDPIIPYDYEDANGIWTDADGVNGYNQRAGVTSYWCAHSAYDYYKNIHGRLSYDGSNGQIDLYSEISWGLWVNPENAAWNTVTHTIQLGAGSTTSATDDWNTLDIIGHELTHGVHQFSVGYNYTMEPGALDESFADIFGERIEAFAKGVALPDWLVGADRGAPYRSLSYPNSYSDPDTYMGDFWQPNTDPYDEYGVHTNSGVQNFWFYLLTMGGSGTNDLGYAYNVTGIGLAPAASIAYRNMDVYLTTSSVYIDSREGAIRAAEDLYGSCSNNVLQTAKAWYAVGVAQVSPDFNYIVPCGIVPNNSWYRGINSLITNGCTTTVSSSFTASFSSALADGITLKKNFTAEQGSTFTAYINECSEASYNLRTSSNGNNSNSIDNFEEANELSLTKVYPNPATDLINVEFFIPSTSSIELSVYDALGRKSLESIVQQSTPLGKNQFELNVSNLPSGIYSIVLKANGKQDQKKFVVAKD